MQLRGRENRFSEAPRASVIEIANELVHVLAPAIGAPYVFFGYSMGRWRSRRLSDSKLNATESPKLFATEKKSHDIIVLLLE